MNEYIMPAKYQNMGCGISVKVSGLEQNNQGNYKYIAISIDGNNYIKTNINQGNADVSNIVSFDNLEENKYYMIYAKIIYNDDSENNFNTKIPSSVSVATATISRTMQEQAYKGGLLIKESNPKVVIL